MNSNIRRISTPPEKIGTLVGPRKLMNIDQLEAELAIVKAELARVRAIRVKLEIELLYQQIEQLEQEQMKFRVYIAKYVR
jgi:ribosomal protein L29